MSDRHILFFIAEDERISKSSHLTLIGSLSLSGLVGNLTEGYKGKEEPRYSQSVAGLQTVNI